MARTRMSDKPKSKADDFKPNAPTVFINKQVVINDHASRGMNQQQRINNGRQNQVAITVQSPDDALLGNVERAVMEVINAYKG